MNLKTLFLSHKSQIISGQSLAVLAGIGLFLFAHFSLRDWAEASELHHTMQHVMIFAAGCSIGGWLVSIFKANDTN